MITDGGSGRAGVSGLHQASDGDDSAQNHKRTDDDTLHGHARDKRSLLVAADRVELATEWRMPREDVNRQRDHRENDERKRNAAKLIEQQDREHERLAGEEKFQEGELFVIHGEAQYFSTSATSKCRDDPQGKYAYAKDPTCRWRKIISREQRLEVGLSAGRDGHRAAADHEPEGAFENQ